MKAFSKFHPFVLMVYFISVFIVAMFVNNPVINVIAILGGLVFSIMLTEANEKISDLKFYIPMLLLISLTNPLFSHNGRTPLFFMNGNAVTLEAIVCGGFIGVMLVGIMLWFKCFNKVLTVDKIVFLFGRIIPKISLVISISLRYVPMLKRQAKSIKKAQKAMGLYSSDSYADKVRSQLRVMSALVGWSMENAVETSKAMKAKGYGLKGHSSYSIYKFRLSDAIMLIVCILLTSLVMMGVISGSLDFSYYPVVSELNVSVSALIAYISFGVLTLIPFFIELEEIIQWNCCKSKI